jgi:hypothetical protein
VDNAEVAVSMVIVNPMLEKKFGDGAVNIEPLTSIFISGTTF